MAILLHPKIDEDSYPKWRLLQTHRSSTFVVDVTKLTHTDDIKKRHVWLHKGSHTDVLWCSFDDNNKVCIEKAAPGASGSNSGPLKPGANYTNVHYARTEKLINIIYGGVANGG